MKKIKVELAYIIEEYEVSIDDKNFAVLKRWDNRNSIEDASFFDENGEDIEDEELKKELLETVKRWKGETV